MTHRPHGLLPDKRPCGDDIHPLTQGALPHTLLHGAGASTEAAAVSVVLSHGIAIWPQGAGMRH